MMLMMSCVSLPQAAWKIIIACDVCRLIAWVLLQH